MQVPESGCVRATSGDGAFLFFRRARRLTGTAGSQGEVLASTLDPNRCKRSAKPQSLPSLRLSTPLANVVSVDQGKGG